MTPDSSASTLRYKQIDAFTERPFGGNPAAVILLDAPLSAGSMQTIAGEMNLSETAFVEPLDGEARPIRWFTPATEVPLCGHATLAASQALVEEGAVAPFRFDSLSGRLTVYEEAAGRLRMDFPADVCTELEPWGELMEALGAPNATSVYRGTHNLIVRLNTQAGVEGLRPDFTALKKLDVGSVLTLSVTAAADQTGVDFASRVFAPWAGIDEDPVTGIAHTALAPFWASILAKTELNAAQVSARGGELGLRVEGDRVHLIGRAITVAEGTMLKP